jgi:ribosomal-protein-alanine N-acetyltransferase
MMLERIDAADAADLAATHARSFDAPWSAADIEALIASPGGFALAVRDGGRPGGFVLCRAIAGEAEVLTLAVDPDFRRRGLARSLLEAAMIGAKAAGAEAMFLEVAADNAAAIGLYEQAGFARVGTRPGYYHRPAGQVDALVMRRDLNSRPG